MKCTICESCMQPETVVTVMRVLGRTRSVVQPGWYCWTCKASTSLPVNRRSPERLHGPASLLRRLSATLTGHESVPAGTFALAGRCSPTGL
jgi:hypothetical protein